MGWPTGIAVYFVVWWLSLFMVLPWGVTPAHRQDIGIMPGAPADPRLRQKFLATSVLAALFWIVIYALVRSNLIDFHDMAARMMHQDGVS